MNILRIGRFTFRISFKIQINGSYIFSVLTFGFKKTKGMSLIILGISFILGWDYKPETSGNGNINS